MLLARRLQVVRVRTDEQWQQLVCGRCGYMSNGRTHQEVYHQREWQGVGVDGKEAGMQGQSQEQKPFVQGRRPKHTDSEMMTRCQ